MKKLFALLTVLCLLLSCAFAEALPEGSGLTLMPFAENDQVHGYLLCDAPCEWGHGAVSFDFVITAEGLVISVSYFDQDGHTADEVLGWDVYLNGDTASPIRCDTWFVFPSGRQTNYTNVQPVPQIEALTEVRLTPVLGEGADADAFTALWAAVEVSDP